MNKDDLPLFPLITALAGYRLIIMDENKFKMLDTDIIISKGLYNKMKELCPSAFNTPENKYEQEK